MQDDTDVPVFVYSQTLGVSATIHNGVLSVQIRGTPKDFESLADLAYRGGGSVVLSVAIRDGQPIIR